MNDTIDNSPILRILILAFVMMMMMTLLIIRLWSVQVLSGREFNEQASRQYARNIRLPALRGSIYSADGILLAGNRPSFNILFHLSEMHLTGSRKRSVAFILSEVKRCEKTIHRPSGITAEKIEHHLKYSPGIPLKIFQNLNISDLSKLAEMLPRVQGMELSADPVRYYPRHDLASHIIGYTGKRDPRTAEDRSEYFYYQPDSQGRTGLEKKYDKQLCGKPGKKMVIVNHRGFIHETVGDTQEAEPACNLYLTIDTRLQQKAEKLLNDKYGSIILMNAENGAILAMASSPGYDLNDFVPYISAKRYRYINNMQGAPFINKSLTGCYMPGSIIKPLMAIAFQRNGLDPENHIVCDGMTPIGTGGFRIRCAAWKRGGHGPLNMVEALKYSCNDYFIEGGTKIGLNEINEVLTSAGLGQKTGFELTEAAGLCPDRKRYPYWGIYDTALISIGQGKILVTPIQTVCYVAAIFNGGILWRPYIVQEIRDGTGKKISTRPFIRGHLAADAEQLGIVQQGMYEAVNMPDGGVRKAKLEDLIIYGKSGTAEVGTREHHTKNTWFIGFCETEQKQKLALSVLVIDGVSGNTTAGPLAAEMFRTAASLNTDSSD